MPIQTQQQLENFLLPPGTEILNPEVKKALTGLTESIATMVREIQERTEEKALTRLTENFAKMIRGIQATTEEITLEEFAHQPQVVGIKNDLTEVVNAVNSMYSL